MCALCAVLAWYELDVSSKQDVSGINLAKKELQLEKIKLEIAKVRKERLDLEKI